MSRLAAEILAGSCDAATLRAAVLVVRLKPEALDKLTREAFPQSENPSRQLFRQAIRWMAETPDREWEGLLKEKPCQK